jgi:hypothetical protein
MQACAEDGEARNKRCTYFETIPESEASQTPTKVSNPPAAWIALSDSPRMIAAMTTADTGSKYEYGIVCRVPSRYMDRPQRAIATTIPAAAE